MKIAYVINSLGLGGAERQLVHICRYLGSVGVTQLVLQLAPPSDWADELRSLGVESIPLSMNAKLARLSPLQRAAMRNAEAFAPNLVVTMLPKSDVVGRFVAMKLGVPSVSIWQDTAYEAHRFDRRLKVKIALTLLRLLERRRLSSRASFIAVSETVRDSYCQALGIEPSSCRVIPNAVDVASFTTQRLENRGRVLLHIGRHVVQKGLDVLLNAVAKLPASSELSFVLVGSGPLTAQLRRLGDRLGVSKRIIWHGPAKDIRPFLSTADGLVFPSRHEGLPLSVLEALAASLPIIASDIRSIREIDPRGDSIFFSRPEDADDLARTMTAFASDAGGRARSSAAAKAIADRFDTATIGQAFHEAFIEFEKRHRPEER